MKKELGYIGLGKMGFNMVERLLEKKYRVVAFNKTPEPTEEAKKRGAEGAYSLAELVGKLPAPRTAWLMVPHQAVDEVLRELSPLLSKGDTVIDGGNSPYEESMRRGKELEAKGIAFLDAGISGGPAGAREGACTMVGGKKELFDAYEELFRDISAPEAYGYMGPSGAGHFVKMVHNGIEYGMMQAIAEGFAVLKESSFGIPLREAARVYNERSVIESRLIGWLGDAYRSWGVGLEAVSGEVVGTGEGLWTVNAAKKLGIPTPIIEGSVKFRDASKGHPSYTGKVLSALRNAFGGHSIT